MMSDPETPPHTISSDYREYRTLAEVRIEYLKARVEELEKEKPEPGMWSIPIGYHITDEQIDAAWKYTKEGWDCGQSVEDALNKINIFECEGCGGEGNSYSAAEYNDKPCPDCNGHGWVIGGEDE
jgi:hypothetical protein